MKYSRELIWENTRKLLSKIVITTVTLNQEIKEVDLGDKTKNPRKTIRTEYQR